MPCPQPKACQAEPSNHCRGHDAQRSLRSLTADTSDAVSYVEDVHKAFVALESLITPVLIHGNEPVEIDRDQLGALFRVMNEALGSKIGLAKEAATQAYRAS